MTFIKIAIITKIFWSICWTELKGKKILRKQKDERFVREREREIQ